jgi:hypothetical protein
MKTAPNLTLILLAILAAPCSYRPARFADRPPVTRARDDTPIAIPRSFVVPEPVYLSEVYLHRPLRNAFDISVIPSAGDVNSMDQVPRSSWFEPRPSDLGSIARGPDSDGPPRPPFTVIAAPTTSIAGGFSITDSRGLRYEICVDLAERPEMRTGAVAIASRLVWMAGLNTPPAFVVRARREDFWKTPDAAIDFERVLAKGPPAVAGLYRIAAVRWPSGQYLGQTREGGSRGDDANDLVAHRDRRTLRALRVFAAWIKLADLGPSKTADVYEGPPGEGFVRHYLVGLDEALGAADVVHTTDLPPPVGGGGPVVRLMTLGLYPSPAPKPTQIDMLAVGELDANVDPAGYRPSTPYEPDDRMLAADAYWAAMRILAIPPAGLALAVDQGRIGNARTQRYLFETLQARGRTVGQYWLGRVTPLELVGVDGNRVMLRDQAIAMNLAPILGTTYRFEWLHDDASRAADSSEVRARADAFAVTVPEKALRAAEDYLILRVVAARDGKRMPRAMQVHMKLRAGKLEVLGVRH